MQAAFTSLQEAKARLPENVHLRDLSVFVLTTMEGGVMQARTYRTPETFDASVRVLRHYFSHLLKEI
jgi:hypothetical protein